MQIVDEIQVILDATEGHDPEESVKFLRLALQCVRDRLNGSINQSTAIRRIRKIKRRAELHDAQVAGER